MSVAHQRLQRVGIEAAKQVGERNPALVRRGDIETGGGQERRAGIEMKAGRSFSASYPAEKSKIVFNEAAIRVMGLKDPVGKTVHLWGEDRQIIGVMKDFNFESLHENLKPCFLDLLVNERASKIMVRIEAGKEKAAIAGGLISTPGAALGPLMPPGRGSDGALSSLTSVRRWRNPRPPQPLAPARIRLWANRFAAAGRPRMIGRLQRFSEIEGGPGDASRIEHEQLSSQ